MGFVRLGELINDSTSVLLFDWALAAEAGISTEFVGTAHYAGQAMCWMLSGTGIMPTHLLRMIWNLWYMQSGM